MQDKFVIKCSDCGKELDLKEVIDSLQMVSGNDDGILVSCGHDGQIYSVTCNCGAVAVY
jgi:uncharacterized Zn finger protein